jgi:integrase
MSRTTCVEPGIYAQVGKRRTSYSTRIAGKYVTLGASGLDEARRRLWAALELHGLEAPAASRSIRAMCEGYIAAQWELLRYRDPAALAEGTILDYEACLRHQLMPRFGDMAIKDFKPMHGAQYLRQRRIEGHAARGNRELSALASAFNHGMALGLVDSNPCRGVRRLRTFPRTRRVTVAELNAFLAFAEKHGPSAYMTAIIGCVTALTGRRRCELLNLRLSSMTDDGILVPEGKIKVGEQRRMFLVEWSPTLRRVINEAGRLAARLRRKSVYLFPSRAAVPYTSDGYKTNWNRLMHAFAPGGVESPEWFRAHDLRALYVSEMLGQDRNPNTHKNEATMRAVYDRRPAVRVTPLV